MKGAIENDNVYRKILNQMNISSPSRRIWLSLLMKEEKPQYEGRDGNLYRLDITELAMIKGTLKRLGIFDIKIPIILYADTSGEQSKWRIEGENECRLISEILDRKAPDAGRLSLYAAHLSELRKKLPTTTVCIYLP